MTPRSLGAQQLNETFQPVTIDQVAPEGKSAGTHI
jgi:hypothetical protein